MPYTNYNWITDQIAIGGLVSEPEEMPFDAILSLVPDAPTTVRELVHGGRVDYRWHSIIDGYSWEEHDEIVRRYSDAAAQLNEWLSHGRRVLVHCVAGVSRSVTTVVWYLVQYRGMTWDEAVNFIRVSRPSARPNIRFEIPLRMAAGEEMSMEWIGERIEVFREHVLRHEGVEPDVQEILDDLERQGTLGRVPVR